MKKTILVIVGVLGVITFCIYYYNDLVSNGANSEKELSTTRVMNYLCLSYCFYFIGSIERIRIKYVLYAISEFWIFISAIYVLNFYFDSLIHLNNVVLIIILTFVCSLLLFSLWWRR